MALLLRKATNPKWALQDWMVAGDVPADALTDLRTEGNSLSVWSVAPDYGNLNVALAALASDPASDSDYLGKIGGQDATLNCQYVNSPGPDRIDRSEDWASGFGDDAPEAREAISKGRQAIIAGGPRNWGT